MADRVGAYHDNGTPAYWIDETNGKPYTFEQVNGRTTSRKIYMPPRALDGYAAGGTPGGFLHGKEEWNVDSGEYERHLNGGNLLAAGVGGAIAAPWLVGAAGAAFGGPGAAASSLPAAAATSAAPAAAASALPAGLVPGGTAAATSGIPSASSGLSGLVGRGMSALKGKGASIVSGALNSYLENRRANKALAQRESELDPYRREMFQAQDANKLDYMANADFASSPTQIRGRYGDAAGPTTPNFTWNPEDATRAAVRTALGTVRRGRPKK